ncbi:MAG: serine hydrolase domain-containing protein [Planctomycetota bacterium]
MKSLLTGLAVVFLLACCTSGQEPNTDLGNPEINAMLQKLIDDSRNSEDKKVTPIPGLVAGIISEDGKLEAGAAGIRKWGTEKFIQPTDLVHIGSCTKAMTATLIGILVDEGKLSFDTTIADGLPALKDSIHKDYLDVTLHQLLTHTSGVPRDGFWAAHMDKPVSERRKLIVEKALERKPKNKTGSKHEYSNLGYCIAGMIAAQSSDTTWEELITKKLFTPLGMTSASFGPTDKTGNTEQPWGHLPLGKSPKPMNRDNPEALGPAGTVHLTLEDWAKFAMLHAGVSNQDLIKPETLEFLQQVPNDHQKTSYASGWIVHNRGWSKGKVLYHNGSNTFWFSVIWVAPKTKTAYFASANGGIAQNVMIAVDQAIVGLIDWQSKN